MTAQQFINEGNLAAALQELQDDVRLDALNAKHRIFLFQLLSVMGNWTRALNQLDVAGKLDADALNMVQTYRGAIQCEALRSEIFSGKRSPLIFGDPQPWTVMLMEALRLSANGQTEQAEQARAAALELAPASSGRIDGNAFTWIADADQRLGPVLEGVLNGRYYWIPVVRIKQIVFDEPIDLRDKVWTPATFTWTNGGEMVGFIPTRYSGTELSSDDSLRLARQTVWEGDAALGQRMLTTDNADYALLDIRRIEFDMSDEDG